MWKLVLAWALIVGASIALLEASIPSFYSYGEPGSVALRLIFSAWAVLFVGSAIVIGAAARLRLLLLTWLLIVLTCIALIYVGQMGNAYICDEYCTPTQYLGTELFFAGMYLLVGATLFSFIAGYIAFRCHAPL